MSPIALAEAIDQLVESHSAFVAEAEHAVTVSDLSAHGLASLIPLCNALAWQCEVFDSDNGIWPDNTPFDQDFSPYRIVISKPAAPDGILRILTNAAFSDWLERGHSSRHWQVARISGSIASQNRLIGPWGEDAVDFSMAPPTKSPRSVVREYGEKRCVPADIRFWLLQDITESLYETSSAKIWIKKSISALVSSMADEIDSDDGGFKFRGPPRLNLPALKTVREDEVKLTYDAFISLQDALKWAFENEREAEMRHILLATELARCGNTRAEAEEFLQENMANALESAKIAYQMALADTSRDTLKSLTDLRKSIAEETAKLSDLSRQLMAAVASSLALGIGLIAARVSTAAPPNLISAVMAVIAIYVSVVILSGMHFIKLQQRIRKEWQPKLYRFLPVEDYKRMVEIPAKQAENSFYWSAGIGWVAVIALTFICFRPEVISRKNESEDIEQKKDIISEQRSSLADSELSPKATNTMPSVGERNKPKEAEPKKEEVP